jgi:hypothetical protein
VLCLRRILSRPGAVLVAAATAAALLALRIATWVEEPLRPLLLYYYVPVALPFVAFLLERAERYCTLSPRCWVIDAPVLALSLARAFVPIPLVSGHALFLAYAFLTGQSRVTRVTAAIVLAQVIHLKIILRDATLVGGMLLGCIGAFIVQRAQRHLQEDTRHRS